MQKPRYWSHGCLALTPRYANGARRSPTGPPVILESAEMSDVLRWSQRAIDLADGDPSKGNLIIGSPLAITLTQRAIARCCLGRPGWRDDLQQALAMARSADQMSYAFVAYAYGVGMVIGVSTADDSVVREIEDALRIAERS